MRQPHKEPLDDLPPPQDCAPARMRRPALTAARVRDLEALARATRIRPRKNHGALFETTTQSRAAINRAKRFIDSLSAWAGERDAAKQ